jgi:hypothetical protein
MKKIFLALSAIGIFSAFAPQQKKQRIVFFGDSITQAGAKPGGYIMVMDSLLKEKKVDGNYELMGAGIGGMIST